MQSLDNVENNTSAFFFSPDSTRMAALCGRNIQLWDLSGRKSLVTLRGHEAAVTSAVFSRSGQWLLTGSDDGTAALWNLQTFAIESIYRGHPGPLRLVAFNPNNQQVATASTDHVVRLWTVDLIPAIMARTSRQLTASERERYEVHE